MSLQRSSRLVRAPCWSCRSSSLRRPSLFDVPTRTATSPIPSAARNYALRRSPRARATAEDYGTFQGLVMSKADIARKFKELANRFEQQHRWIYESARKNGMIDPKLGPKTFLEIGRKLIREAGETGLSAAEVQRIYPDPNRVFDVGHVIDRACCTDQLFASLYYTATADAGAVIPLAFEILTQLKKMAENGNIRPSKETDRMISIARETRNPLARRMWAELLRRSGQTKEALKLLHELLAETYPSNTPEPRRDSITLQGNLKPPWEAIAEIYYTTGSNRKGDEMTKYGALIYRNPDALIAYAFLMKAEQNWEAYEQCMVVAATSNNGEAHFRLGNYYYNIYNGNIPSRDELNEKKNTFASSISKLFGQSRTKADFRQMAINWYELGALHNYMPALRNYVVLRREDGDYDGAMIMLQKLKKEPEAWNSPNITKLRDSFYDRDFQPKLPPSWIEL